MARYRGLRAAARALGVSPSTVHGWIESRALDARKLASGVLSIEAVPVATIRARAARTKAKRAASAGRLFEPLTRARETSLGLPPRAPTEAEDIIAVGVNIFAPVGQGRGFGRRARAALLDCLDLIADAIGGVPHPSHVSLYQGQVDLAQPVTDGALATALARARIPRAMLRGGRLHLSILTLRGVYIPISYAYARPRDAVLYAVSTLRRGSRMLGDTDRNRSALNRRSADRRTHRKQRDEINRCEHRRASDRARCWRVAEHLGAHRYSPDWEGR